jgi:hypothetical protein
MTLGHLAYKSGIMSFAPILLNEVVPFAAKSATSEFIQLFPIFISMITAMSYLPVEHNVGALYNLPFFFISLLLFCLLWFLLPETNVKEETRPLSRTTSYGSIGNELRRLSMTID